VPDFRVIESAGVAAYLRGALRDPVVRAASDDPASSVFKIIERVARAPLFLYVDDGSDKYKRLNFTSWVRVLSERPGQYTSDAISDLYHLHELRHMATLRYEPGLPLEDWVRRIKQNEKDTTLYSEAWIHFELPALRARLPIRHVWADRYLDERIRLHPELGNRDFHRRDPRAFREALLCAFLSIDERSFHELDDLEIRTAEYSGSNDQFARVWASSNDDLEAHMCRFYQLVDENEERAAIEFHRAWLEAKSGPSFIFSRQAVEYYERSHTLKVAFHRRPFPSAEEVDAALRAQADRFAALEAETKIAPTPLVAKTREMIERGITATVYALPTEEARAVSRDVYRALETEAGYFSTFGEPYTRKQDPVHLAFLDAYREWSAPIVRGLDGFSHAYPSNGSSEAIKDAIAFFLKTKSPGARLHVFRGEYEGASALARGHAIEVVEHERSDAGIDGLFLDAGPHDYFFLSQPSSLDGNVWGGYEAFVRRARDEQLSLLIDLCYVGCVDEDFSVDVSAPNICAVFFALSKSFGVYYQRIGGGFFRESIPSLEGNRWFKNLTSLAIGTELLRRFSVRTLPRRYRPYQEEAVARINARLGISLAPSDVFLLAHQRAEVAPDPFLAPFLRHGIVRACLTPMLEAMSSSALAHKSRYAPREPDEPLP
jgi:histidinol-phosphate/aromatic aminotransferase/cobyric acid decarboxylase-like protein